MRSVTKIVGLATQPIHQTVIAVIINIYWRIIVVSIVPKIVWFALIRISAANVFLVFSKNKESANNALKSVLNAIEQTSVPNANQALLQLMIFVLIACLVVLFVTHQIYKSASNVMKISTLIRNKNALHARQDARTANLSIQILNVILAKMGSFCLTPRDVLKLANFPVIHATQESHHNASLVMQVISSVEKFAQ